MDIDNITSIKSSLINRKIVHKIVFFMLLSEKSLEIFSKRKGYFFISESFAMNGYIFVALINKQNCCSHYNAGL